MVYLGSLHHLKFIYFFNTDIQSYNEMLFFTIRNLKNSKNMYQNKNYYSETLKSKLCKNTSYTRQEDNNHIYLRS